MVKEYTKVIFTPYITVKGRRIYASQYGKKAFCFTVKIKK